MRTTVARLGQHFGNLAKVRGIVVHTLSPFEQRGFAGAIKKGIPNTLRRMNEEVFYVVPPFIVGYMIYNWVEDAHTKSLRKDPKEFENDV